MVTDSRKAGRRQQVLLVLGSAVFLSLAASIADTSFNNFVNDTFHISAGARGHLEFPRELPGFLTALLSGALFFMVETRTAALAALGVAAGLFGLAARGDHYLSMVAFMVLWSAGTHLMMPLQGSIILGLAEEGKQATLLGRLGSAGTAATIIGCGFLWFSIQRLHLDYSVLFAISGVAAVGAALFLLAMRSPTASARRKPFLVRRRYTLFYILSILFGARKQIFITFGPWVLIKVFHQPASTFAQLLILSSILGVFLKPVLGQWIDRYGERPILIADAVLLTGVCLGYGFAEQLGLGRHAITLIYVCYMLDQVLFATGMARTTYLDKIAVEKSDLAPTLSLGVSLDHLVSMTVPTLGGLLWDRSGYAYVFLAAAVLAVLNGVAASCIRTPKGVSAPGQ